MGGLQASRSRHRPERTPYVRRVELGPVSSGEHQIVVHPPLPHPNPLAELMVSVLAERVDAQRRQLQGSLGLFRFVSPLARTERHS